MKIPELQKGRCRSEDLACMRVAFVAGTLEPGGAEKQLLYMVRALLAAGVQVRVFCATRGERYEAELRALNCPVEWFGSLSHPLARLTKLIGQLRGYRPHVIQSSHFYTNLYASLAARACGALGFGALRNDAIHEVAANGSWGPWLLRIPAALIANSQAARQNAQAYGISADRVQVLPNVIDLPDFDRRAASDSRTSATRPPTAFAISRLVAAKRLDRFLTALQVANQHTELQGVIVGDGPERGRLETLAGELKLLPERVRFAGWRPDIPALLPEAEMLVLASDHEGFPNILLEAMAARLPVITTPAGDAASVVRHERTGYVVDFDDGKGLAERMVRLAQDADLRRELGNAGRERVAQCYSLDQLADRLLRVYRETAWRRGKVALAGRLSA